MRINGQRKDSVVLCVLYTKSLEVQSLAKDFGLNVFLFNVYLGKLREN